MPFYVTLTSFHKKCYTYWHTGYIRTYFILAATESKAATAAGEKVTKKFVKIDLTTL